MAQVRMCRSETLVAAILVLGLTVKGACREPAGSGVRLTESARYGEDEIVGVLQVSGSDAYFQAGGRRISLIHASPFVAVGPELLKAQAAESLRWVSGKKVRARGDLQGSILWEATSAPPE